MKKYAAFTLLELIIVMIIMVIIMSISVLSFRSLVDSFSINEVSLSIAQDIRGAQRAAMLMDRQTDERWLYGIGIDFTNIESERTYDIFKWCSEYDFYSSHEGKLNGEIPNWNGNLEDSRLDDPLPFTDECKRGMGSEVESGRFIIDTKRYDDYTNLDFELITSIDYILYEAVSGKAFFYSSNFGNALMNYYQNPSDNQLYLSEALENFELEIGTRSENISWRKIKIAPVSGIIFFQYERE
jgi:type II secretory pathway pseudopilin PulG